MSSASKSKSKDKTVGMELSIDSSNLSGNVNTNEGIPGSEYKPLLRAFHPFETALIPSMSPLNVNGRLRNIDDADDHNGNLFGTVMEYDSVSNNGSWSGESEDLKEKPSQSLLRPESVPGAENEKRDQIRRKNEKKHQRQKERRAQELHERCNGFLMSRKLEALAQQLVSMGFSLERATMALILNEGRVEESVAWLFEGGEEDKLRQPNLEGGGNLKIDISEELVHIRDMEIRYKVSKQVVERAVVASEGNLEIAEETLKAQKQDPPVLSPMPGETCDPAGVASGKLSAVLGQNTVRIQMRPASSIQQRSNQDDFNHAKVPLTMGTSLDTGIKSRQVLKNIPPKLEWAVTQQIAVSSDKRWPISGSNPSVSYSLASSLQASPPSAMMESHYVAVGNELRNLRLGSVKEPITVTQRPQSFETVTPNMLVPPAALPRSTIPNGIGVNPSYNQFHYQSNQQFMPSSSPIDSQGTRTSANNASWTRRVAPPSIAPASSLGLFSGFGVNGASGSSSSPVDWSTGNSMSQFDYSNIDWSLDWSLSSSSRHNGLRTCASHYEQNNGGQQSSFFYGADVNPATKPVMSNRILGLQDRIASSEPCDGSSRDWTSPFEEKDLFSFPRQFVYSPSL